METILCVAFLSGLFQPALAREPAAGPDAPPAAERAPEDERSSEALLHDGKLVCLDSSGRIRVWQLSDGAFDATASSALAREGLLHIAARGESLFAVDKDTVWHWSDAARAWDAVSTFEAGDEPPRALAVVGATPVLVFGRSVLSPMAGRRFDVPPLQGMGKECDLRCLAVLGTDGKLWIGTGYGEWGGHLLGLDVKTGAWTQFRDAMHYATGIAPSSPDELFVSWSMSHFRNTTQLRVHGLDGTPKTEFPELEGKYVQRIAQSAFDATLYGIEREHVVRFEDGTPRPLVPIEGIEYEQERKAIGVAPAIAALLSFAPRALAIVPRHGQPWLFRSGELRRLSVP